jgi:hypothetical protein
MVVVIGATSPFQNLQVKLIIPKVEKGLKKCPNTTPKLVANTY